MADSTIDLDKLFAAAWRQKWVFVLACLAGLALGIAYLFSAVPLYTASTDLIIDQTRVRAVQDFAATELGLDSGAVDSQVELLKSERIAASVVDALDLTQNRQFMSSQGSVIRAAINGVRSLLDLERWFGAGTPVVLDKDEAVLLAEAVERLQRNLDVSRVGRSYVLRLSYTSPFPDVAARIANAYAEAYIRDQLDSKYDATRRASSWLQERLEELKLKSLETDLAVQKFRSDNNLTAAGGRLLTEQQLSELNSQLVVARAETARARARYDRIKSIMDSGATDAVVTDALDSSVINDLRRSYLQASKREAEISAKLGDSHVQAVNLRNEMREYERLLFEELGRISESYWSEYQVAKSREESLTESLAALVGVNATANENLVSLRELERQSATYRNLHETFMQRYQEAMQQQSFPMTDARVITRASVPNDPSHPKAALVIALSLVMGSAAGVGFGALRELQDRVFRTGSQVRDELGLEFLGMLPSIPATMNKKSSDTPPAVQERLVEPSSSILRHVLDAPLSGYSETLRAVKLAMDLRLHANTPKILGIVSVLPSEGKSTTSKNFATLLASQGAKTLLVDGDLRNPALTRAIARGSEAGLLEALTEGWPLEQLYRFEPESGLVFLPAVIRRRVPNTSDLVSSSAMRALLEEAGKSFDYIVVDLPPVGPVVDAAAAAALMDAFLFVVEWGRTARGVVRTTIQSEHDIREKSLGVVLNKVPIAKLKLYEGYGSKEYYYGKYSSYYRDN